MVQSQDLHVSGTFLLSMAILAVLTRHVCAGIKAARNGKED